MASITEDTHTESSPPSRLLANRDFVKFWVGETVSLFGTQVTTLAIPLTAVFVLDVGPEQLGFLRFAQFVSFLVFPLPFGVWVDRHRHRPVMVGANAARALLIGLVPILAFAGVLQLNLLYVIALAVGICTVLFDVCWMSYVPTVVHNPDHLVEANGKIGMSYSTAEIAGPGLAGVLVQILSAPWALAIDAFSYLVSIATLLSIRTVEPPPAPKLEDRSFRREIGEGLRFVIGNRYLRVIAALGSLYNFFFMFIEAMFVLFAVQTLGFSAGVLGLTLSAGAIGGFAGAASVGRLSKWLPVGRVYQVSVLIGFTSPVLLAAAGGPEAVAVAMVFCGLFLISFGLGIANVIAISLRQAITPKPLMARMNAAMRTLMYGLGSLGALAGGFVAAAIGLRAALWVAAIGSVSATLPLFGAQISRLRELPTQDSTVEE
jgi:MFS family permease